MDIDNEIITQMQRDVRRILSIIDNGGFSQNRLVLGRFQPGEQIQMADSRLYDGNGSPFTNYQQMARAKRKGCPFTTPDNVRQWSIKAEDLEEWLQGGSQKNVLMQLK
jgi:hypothetical protein